MHGNHLSGNITSVTISISPIYGKYNRQPGSFCLPKHWDVFHWPEFEARHAQFSVGWNYTF